jgi:hypothetical protein
MSGYRSAIAKKAGKTGGCGRPKILAGELEDVKAEIDKTIKDLRAGDLERGKAAAIVQAFNVKLRAIEIERKAYETESLEAELAELRSMIERADPLAPRGPVPSHRANRPLRSNRGAAARSRRAGLRSALVFSKSGCSGPCTAP